MASPLDMLLNKVKEEPVVFLFLGATMAALGGGLRTLATGDKRQSQLMMRARVFFQLCTVTTLAGTIYWKAYTGETRAWLTHQFDSFLRSPDSHTCTPSYFLFSYGPTTDSWSKAPRLFDRQQAVRCSGR